MGEVIKKTAAADKILGDVNKTLTGAAARGGSWDEEARRHLGSISHLAATVDAQLALAHAAQEPLLAAVRVADARADALLGKTYDDIWNAVGRPAHDPALDLLFPSGVAYYADGNLEEQPDRMDLLVELLGKGLHPKLDAATAKGQAEALRGEAAKLRAAVEAARTPTTRVRLLEKVRVALAKTGHSALAALKRTYKAQGHSEAEIHQVIPAHATHAGPAEPPAA